MKKLKSLTKKIVNIDLQAYYEGLINLKKGLFQEEAEQRFDICKSCPNMEIEPIEELRVKDNSIPGISDMMCNECGCEIALKVRQDISKCPLKKW